MASSISKHNGMVVAPHYLAAQAGADILSEGGNAVEAMLAAAASIAVTYPHMNGLGGDNFWLIHSPDQGLPWAIDACGGAAGIHDGRQLDAAAIRALVTTLVRPALSSRRQ